MKLDSAGAPLDGTGKKVQTGTRGEYEFNHLSSGNYRIGVNLEFAPDIRTPFPSTTWSESRQTSIHLNLGESKHISPFRLPQPLKMQSLTLEVRWPDGKPASGIRVWADVGGRTVESGQTDTDGRTTLKLLQGINYSIEAWVWIGEGPAAEVARSGAIQITPADSPIHHTFILNQRTKNYR